MSGALVLLLSVLAGALIAAQAPIYARLALGLGSAMWAGLAGFAVGLMVFAMALILGGTPLPRIEMMRGMPYWVWLGGVFGAAIILLSIAAVPRIGAASFLVTVITGQLVAGLLFDSTGAFGLPLRPVTGPAWAGLALVLAGAVLILRR